MIERTILMGFYIIHLRTTLTAAGLLQSGQPINRIPLGFGTTDLNVMVQAFRMPIRKQ
jgi:hypothetical protein